jgi:hypothetical protein
MATFDEIQDAFFFVSSAQYGMHSAILCKDNGDIYYRSQDGAIDELNEDEPECDEFIHIPHKNDLGLGQDLVFEFVQSHLAAEFDHVQQVFSGREAYGRFKDLLRQKGLLQRWFAYENQREEVALREWALKNEIEIETSDPPAFRST